MRFQHIPHCLRFFRADYQDPLNAEWREQRWRDAYVLRVAFCLAGLLLAYLWTGYVFVLHFGGGL